MTIIEMHQSFRVLCQKMGMQLVRTILPEEIDVFLNLSIIEKVREIVNINASTIFQDKVTNRDNFISPVNALRNLFINEEINTEIPFIYDISDIKALYFTSFVVRYYNNQEYSCRIIEPDKLENTLRDYCNGASYDYPICSVYVNDDKQICKIYNNNKEIKSLIVKYIKYPNVVSYRNNINCDILEYLHTEIVQNAVNKYFISSGLSNQVNN